MPKRFTLSQYKTLELAVSPDELNLARKNFKEEIERTKNDTTPPESVTILLAKLFNKELIEAKYSELLLKIMSRCRRGSNRLMGLLPPETLVAHKTGTLPGFTCDIGIITLPNDFGNIAISAYIKNSSKDLVNNERVLAEVGRSVYDFILFCLINDS